MRAAYALGTPANIEVCFENIPFNLSTGASNQEPFRSYFAPTGSVTYADGTVRYSPDQREADGCAIGLEPPGPSRSGLGMLESARGCRPVTLSC